MLSSTRDFCADTIPGRQCMASCFFLLKQFQDVLIYLGSIKVIEFRLIKCTYERVHLQNYFYNEDTFNFNLAQTKAAIGNFQEAEELFLMIQSEKIKNDLVYLSWLARCCTYSPRKKLRFFLFYFLLLDIMNLKPRLAWELYLRMETSSESYSVLQMIANDCYKVKNRRRYTDRFGTTSSD